MINKIIIIAIVLTLISGIAYYAITAKRLDFESVCEDKDHSRYTKLCNNVGLDAYSQKSISRLTNKNYGRILGVVWRKKGQIISSSRQKTKRRSKKNDYYYIIGTSGENGAQFLRITSEIDAK